MMDECLGGRRDKGTMMVVSIQCCGTFIASNFAGKNKMQTDLHSRKYLFLSANLCRNLCPLNSQPNSIFARRFKASHPCDTCLFPSPTISSQSPLDIERFNIVNLSQLQLLSFA